MKKSKLKIWEIAALLALATVLLWGAWTAHSQDMLARKMIRLHVIANSDSEQDQTLKLQVRDKVLAEATAILEEADNMPQAAQKLEESLPDMEAIAAEEIRGQGYDYPVTARLEETEFPTKDYDGFRLPSGEYLALMDGKLIGSYTGIKNMISDLTAAGRRPEAPVQKTPDRRDNSNRMRFLHS